MTRELFKDITDLRREDLSSPLVVTFQFCDFTYLGNNTLANSCVKAILTSIFSLLSDLTGVSSKDIRTLFARSMYLAKDPYYQSELSLTVSISKGSVSFSNLNGRKFATTIRSGYAAKAPATLLLVDPHTSKFAYYLPKSMLLTSSHLETVPDVFRYFYSPRGHFKGSSSESVFRGRKTALLELERKQKRLQELDKKIKEMTLEFRELRVEIGEASKTLTDKTTQTLANKGILSDRVLNEQLRSYLVNALKTSFNSFQIDDTSVVFWSERWPDEHSKYPVFMREYDGSMTVIFNSVKDEQTYIEQNLPREMQLSRQFASKLNQHLGIPNLFKPIPMFKPGDKSGSFEVTFNYSVGSLTKPQKAKLHKILQSKSK